MDVAISCLAFGSFLAFVEIDKMHNDSFENVEILISQHPNGVWCLADSQDPIHQITGNISQFSILCEEILFTELSPPQTKSTDALAITLFWFWTI